MVLQKSSETPSTYGLGCVPGFPPQQEKEEAMVGVGGLSLMLSCHPGTNQGVRSDKTSGHCSTRAVVM